MKSVKSMPMVCALLVLFVTSQALALDLIDPRYQAEVVHQYQTDGRAVAGMAFDQSGNLYTTHNGSGRIYKLTPSGDVSIFASGLYGGQNMEWATGTAYGDYLYVSDLNDSGNSGRIMRYDSTGTGSVFCALNDEPVAFGIDRYGDYGSKMYFGTNANDKIYSLDTFGVKSVFTYWPYGMGGGPNAINFEAGQKYGGGMYVSNFTKSDAYPGGVYSLSPNAGTIARLSASIKCSLDVDIDNGGLLGGDMFVLRRPVYDVDLQELCRVDPQGNVEVLSLADKFYRTEFGPDGALYVSEHDYSTDITTISRVTLVPEPCLMGLLAAGVLGLRRRNKSC